MDDVKGRGDTFNDGTRYFGVVESNATVTMGMLIKSHYAWLSFNSLCRSEKFMCLVKVVDLKSLLKSKCAAVFMGVLYG